MCSGLAALAGRVARGDDGRLRATWRVLVPLVVVVPAFFAVGGVAVLLGLDRGEMMVFSFVTMAVLAGGVAWAAARWLDRRPVAAYGYRRSRDWLADLVGGVALGVLLVAVAVAVAELAGVATVTAGGPFAGPLLPWLALFVVAFACVGFYEELLFRGLVVTNVVEGVSARGYSRRVAAAVALVASTAVFAAVHVPSALAGGAPAGLVAARVAGLGVLLALAYLWSGDLALPTGLHFGVNVATVNLFGVSGGASLAAVPTVLAVESAATGAWSPANGIPVLAATAATSLLVAAWCRWRSGPSTGDATRPPRRSLSTDD